MFVNSFPKAYSLFAEVACQRYNPTNNKLLSINIDKQEVIKLATKLIQISLRD